MDFYFYTCIIKKEENKAFNDSDLPALTFIRYWAGRWGAGGYL
jgi:hypothetical protein